MPYRAKSEDVWARKGTVYFLAHSCGHRNCPHCQAHESQQWLERQLKKQVPANYFLVTFTLPAEFRALAWQHQKLIYSSMIRCGWETLKTFSQNDRKLQGVPGAIAVLHTHSRRLDFHPHVHLVMPAGTIDRKRRLWRTKKSKGKKPYLFNHTTLAKVFQMEFGDTIPIPHPLSSFPPSSQQAHAPSIVKPDQ